MQLVVACGPPKVPRPCCRVTLRGLFAFEVSAARHSEPAGYARLQLADVLGRAVHIGQHVVELDLGATLHGLLGQEGDVRGEDAVRRRKQLVRGVRV